MRQLSDILIEKSKQVGGHAALGRLLGGLTGQAIGQYIAGKGMPSLTTAIKWKEAFDENLVELLLNETRSVTVNEHVARHGESTDKTILAMEKTIETQDKLIKELNSQLNEYRLKESKVKK